MGLQKEMIFRWFKRKVAAWPAASVYRWPDRYLVATVSTTTPGFGIEMGPFQPLHITASADDIGLAVLHALAQSKFEVPVPVDYESMTRDRFEAAHVTSERQFMESSLHVSIQRNKQAISLWPSRNGGTRGDKKGFQFIPGEITLNLSANSTALGEAVLRAFSMCK